MLTDRLLPDILDPSQKKSMETTVDELKKEIAVKNSRIQSLQVTSDTTQDLEAVISKLKQDIQTKDAQIQNFKQSAAADMTPATRFVLSNLETATNTIVPDSLHYNWDGMRVAFVNRKNHRVIDWGRGDATAYLYSDAIYGFGNHTVTFKLEGNINEKTFWWSLLVNNGKASIRQSPPLQSLH